MSGLFLLGYFLNLLTLQLVMLPKVFNFFEITEIFDGSNCGL